MSRGFSLLELSIVLVIIGLITGGIMAGQSMVHAAELRSIMSDFNKFRTASLTFREKYGALPGDLKNAVRYWGAAAGGTADGTDTTCNAVTTVSAPPLTCNGNGNGRVDNGTETYRFWQHLTNAGLLEGQMTGVPDNGWFTAGINVPATKIQGVGYYFYYIGVYAGDANRFAGSYGHWLSLLMESGNGSSGVAISTEDAAGIDSKIDDGKPALGTVTAIYWATCTNATGNTDTAATYRLTTSGKQCGLQINNFFE